MKRNHDFSFRLNHAFTFLLIFLLSTNLFASNESKHRIILLHPTVSNIENALALVKDGLIDIPNLEMLGVYYADENYDYSASEKYLAEHHIENYHLEKVEGKLTLNDLFRKNACTEQLHQLFESADAVLFFGGPDIPPSIYGAKQELLTSVTDPMRHFFEASFFFHLIGGERNPDFKPFLEERPDFVIRAFCLGMQTMNVAAGGTLIQDIPQDVYGIRDVEDVLKMSPAMMHRNYFNGFSDNQDIFYGHFHPIRLVKDGYFVTDAGFPETATPYVLSAHHQCAGKVGQNLKVIATSMDGKIVEGLQSTRFPNVIGVQFHPEQDYLYHPNKKFKRTNDESFSPERLLQRTNSLAFHKAFWKDFSRKVTESKK
ncbi:gamma-glutamyl-gamma-aminobutyrate hydrolase family protein [Prolixibacter denitrificans]|uniref:Putative glutamine amidotransferase n=1 Tax=Prolixibacter denitrificans TaxID=1541063 RepID=A0A2P8CL71_9BACT|nr:gamma-glutamyl-gamma-aminobutyrate hydrolase family protein [Prolixibacter denitrificans]PSK85710.1 putative glutamine amidotransferase [Prolixibacter denitrificans]GET20329.1 hypothetical protein JCM18694_05750 [Prolixibacter denitrificans]